MERIAVVGFSTIEEFQDWANKKPTVQIGKKVFYAPLDNCAFFGIFSESDIDRTYSKIVDVDKLRCALKMAVTND